MRNLVKRVISGYRTSKFIHPYRFKKIQENFKLSLGSCILHEYLAEDIRERWGPRYFFSIHEKGEGYLYQDTKYQVALNKPSSTKHGLPLAVIGFDLEPLVIKIGQIQGRKKVRGLPPNWEIKFLETVKDWASRVGFRQIRMIRAENHKYYANPEITWKDGEEKELEKRKIQERMRKRYNETAERFGFRFDRSLDEYVLDLR